MFFRLASTASLACLSLSLISCGGGGSNPSAPSLPPVQIDTLPPVVVAPNPMTVKLNANETSISLNDPRLAAFLQGASASDNVGIAGAISTDAPTVFQLGETPVIFSAKDAAGNVGIAASTLSVVDSGSQLRLLAGDLGGQGNINGLGKSARFDNLSVMAIDGSNNIYVATADQTIRKVNSVGVVSAFVGSPASKTVVDGTGSAAQFLQIMDMSADGKGNIYVSDSNSIRKVTPAGVVTTIATGSVNQKMLDGPLAAAKFTYISGIASDFSGNIYVTDFGMVRKISSDGTVTSLFKSDSSRIVVDSTGNVYIPGNPVTKITSSGSSASLDISGNQLAVDANGNLYAADATGKNIVKRSASGTTTTIVKNTDLSATSSLLVDGSGNLFTSANSYAIQKISPDGVATTFAGNAIATANLVNSFGSVTVDAKGDVYVADALNNSVRKVTKAGAITTFAGAPGRGTTQIDGIGTAANFSRPNAMTFDKAGNLYVSDYSVIANRVVRSVGNTIRRIDPAASVTTFAGVQSPRADGLSDFDFPSGIAMDANGNLLVADAGSGSIRKITPAGTISSLALRQADNMNIPVQLSLPGELTIDNVGNLYVIHRHAVLKIAPNGGVSVVAGKADNSGSADGLGSMASFSSPQGIASDGNGNLFVADTGNNTIRKITPTGLVSTVVGSAKTRGIRTGSLPASLDSPLGVAVFNNNLIITSKNAILTVQP